MTVRHIEIKIRPQMKVDVSIIVSDKTLWQQLNQEIKMVNRNYKISYVRN